MTAQGKPPDRLPPRDVEALELTALVARATRSVGAAARCGDLAGDERRRQRRCSITPRPSSPAWARPPLRRGGRSRARHGPRVSRADLLSRPSSGPPAASVSIREHPRIDPGERSDGAERDNDHEDEQSGHARRMRAAGGRAQVAGRRVEVRLTRQLDGATEGSQPARGLRWAVTFVASALGGPRHAPEVATLHGIVERG